MAQMKINFMSYTLGYPVDIELVLPTISACDLDPGKDHSHRVRAKYPVLYLLHGHGNDAECWMRYTSVQRYAEEHRIAAVSMSVGNTCYLNADAYGENFYAFIQEELPEFLCENFPISGRREDTYICGYSMGGYGTLLHALSAPGQYRAAGVFSPGVHIGDIRKRHGIPEPVEPEELIAKARGKVLPDLFLCVGKDDFLYEDVKWLHHALDEADIPHLYDDLPGYGHEFALWDMELKKFIEWLPRTDYYADQGLHAI